MIVIGGLHTDIVARGVKNFPQAGELVRGTQLAIGPGGKSRNIAAMAGYLSDKQSVALIGRTAEDQYGLWKPPVEALEAAGVNTDFVYVEPLGDNQKMPAITLVPVTEKGESQIFLLPGISDDFSPEDVDSAHLLFIEAAQNNAFLVLSLECPIPTLKHAAKKAQDHGMRIIFDPGGLETGMDASELVQQAFVIIPNEHEAKLLSGVTVTDFNSARTAADAMKEQGATNVLITHGEHGAYLFTEDEEFKVSIPSVKRGSVRDATGCGDQATATFGVALRQGKSLLEAAQLAVLGGTLQFYKAGIQPITQQEIDTYLNVKS